MSGPAAAVIRQATRADVERIAAFIRGTYGRYALHIVPDRWNWQYLENPLVDGETIPLCIAVRGDEVVGITSGIPVALQIGDRLHDAKWSCEMMVHPSCRGQGLGLGLQKTDAENTPLFISVRMAPSTRYIQGKIGCIPFDPVGVHVRIAHPTRRDVRNYLLLRTARRRRLNRLARFACRFLAGDAFLAGVLRTLAFLRDRGRGLPAPASGTAIREIDRFGPETDRLWESTRRRYGVIARRDAAFLNWKTLDHPSLPYRAFLAERGGEVRGYLILRRSDPEEPSVGHVIDLFAAPDDRLTLDALVVHAIRVFGKERAVVQCEASAPALVAVLRARGFRRTGSITPTYRAHDPAVAAELDRRRSEWFITRIDQDLDQLRPIWAAGVRL